MSESRKGAMNLAWKRANRAADSAHKAVRWATRTGRLTRPAACSRCGASGVPIEGHHDDYSRPLDVEWLCRACHAALHKERARAGDGDRLGQSSNATTKEAAQA